MSVNGVGPAAVSADAAAGTTYDAATVILRASTPVTPGAHSLYLSIFDNGDPTFDCAVLVDRVGFGGAAGAACAPGVVTDATPPGASGTGSTPLGPSAPGGAVGGSGAGGTTPPVPALGRSVVGGLISGTVRVTFPDGTTRTLGPGASIPLGSSVDARRGHVRITAADGTGGTMSGEFWDGVFRVTQPAGRPVTTDLKLVEDVGLKRCPKLGRGARSARRRKPGRRLLWGDGKGRFRTSGNYGAAVVRGTRWLVQDSCAGTLVKVVRGVVDVRDAGRRRTVTVNAGRRYLARRRR